MVPVIFFKTLKPFIYQHFSKKIILKKFGMIMQASIFVQQQFCFTLKT
jgi:hypothetical protein